MVVVVVVLIGGDGVAVVSLIGGDRDRASTYGDGLVAIVTLTVMAMMVK